MHLYLLLPSWWTLIWRVIFNLLWKILKQIGHVFLFVSGSSESDSTTLSSVLSLSRSSAYPWLWTALMWILRRDIADSILLIWIGSVMKLQLVIWHLKEAARGCPSAHLSWSTAIEWLSLQIRFIDIVEIVLSTVIWKWLQTMKITNIYKLQNNWNSLHPSCNVFFWKNTFCFRPNVDKSWELKTNTKDTSTSNCCFDAVSQGLRACIYGYQYNDVPKHYTYFFFIRNDL